MIFAESTEKGVGVCLYGDELDLRSLHGTAHAIINAAPITEQHREDLLGLFAYEIRKAFERHREKITVGSGPENTYFGARFTWPVILFNVAILRQCAAFCENTKEHLSNLHRIEYSLEQELLSYDQRAGSEIVAAFRDITLFGDDFLVEFVQRRSYDYIFNCGEGKMRFRRLPAILGSLHDLSPQYKKFREKYSEEANRLRIDPNELEDGRESNEFEW